MIDLAKKKQLCIGDLVDTGHLVEVDTSINV